MKPNFKETDTTIALYALCLGHHQGKSSRGYRLRTKLHKRLKRHGFTEDEIYALARLGVRIKIFRKWADKYIDAL